MFYRRFNLTLTSSTYQQYQQTHLQPQQYVGVMLNAPTALDTAVVKIRPRKACRYPNLRSFGWVSYDKVGGLYSGKLGIRSEARASDLGSYPGLWWKRI